MKFIHRHSFCIITNIIFMIGLDKFCYNLSEVLCPLNNFLVMVVWCLWKFEPLFKLSWRMMNLSCFPHDTWLHTMLHNCYQSKLIKKDPAWEYIFVFWMHNIVGRNGFYNILWICKIVLTLVCYFAQVLHD